MTMTLTALTIVKAVRVSLKSYNQRLLFKHFIIVLCRLDEQDIQPFDWHSR